MESNTGSKGGTFSYAVDRDFSGSYTDNLVTPDYHVTRKIISILNPLLTSSAITSGATYQLVSAVNNTSVLDVEGGATANSTKHYSGAMLVLIIRSGLLPVQEMAIIGCLLNMLLIWR